MFDENVKVDKSETAILSKFSSELDLPCGIFFVLALYTEM
jgi:hypothetical protein